MKSTTLEERSALGLKSASGVCSSRSKAAPQSRQAALRVPKGRSIMPFYRQSSIEKNLKLRARTVQAVRDFFIGKDYLEIETPCRIPAPAPEEHIDAQISGDWFLQTSPELCMKRLLAAGYHRMFQICKCFRQNERGSKHLPELTMLEWYTSGTDYFEIGRASCRERV